MQKPTVVEVVEAHDLADPAPHHGQRRARAVGAADPFDLQEGERHVREHDVMRPALIGAAFEVVEAELVLELAVLLFDRPAAARQRDQLAEAGGGREMDQIILAGVGRAFTEQPALPPVPRWAPRAARRTPAVRGPAVPVPQVTVSHTSSGAASAIAIADSGLGTS